jgi:uncharacterized phage protein (TIGR02218 family)
VVIGRYTSGEADVTVDGNTYSTYPGGLARGEISISGERGRAALRITVARDHPVASLIHLRPRTGVIGCTVQRYHRGGRLRRDHDRRGAGAECAPGEGAGERILVVEPRSVSQQRIGLHRVCQPGCNWQLYGSHCRLDMGDWGHATTIVSVSGTALEVADVESGMPYAGGIVAFTEGGITDYAYIEEADGTALTLDLPLYGAEASEAVTLYPGCDWTMATCDAVFSNSVNFGGRLHLPDLNPVTQSAF